ncbi:MAG: hypothetical protein ACUVQ9_07650 [Thermodesulfobacteriota bacterium]
MLYATDLSKNSAYAFYYAVDIAKKGNANIIITCDRTRLPLNSKLCGELDDS